MAETPPSARPHPSTPFGAATPTGDAEAAGDAPDAPGHPAPGARILAPQWSEALLSRIEDAGLNASAPPQQRWLDGWLLRTCPGKAKRARCVQAVADGRLPLTERLALARRGFDDAGLPPVWRITPFSRPADLDAQLQALGWRQLDDTRVMLLDLADAPALTPTRPADDDANALARWAAGAGLRAEPESPQRYAALVGALRGSPVAQCQAHAQRLLASPVPYQGWVLWPAAGSSDAGPLCAAQTAAEDDMVGLYDVHTATAARGRGLAGALCGALLRQARAQGCRWAYLQVDADNHAARAVYRRLGFADAFSYHYRAPAEVEPG